MECILGIEKVKFKMKQNENERMTNLIKMGLNVKFCDEIFSQN